MQIVVLLVVLVLGMLVSAVRVLREYERGVVFRLGRLWGSRGPGLILLIPLVERMQRVSLRTVTLEVAPQDLITRDNVSVGVSAVVYFRVLDANRAIVAVEHFLFATAQLAQTTLRSVCGQALLDELLAERERINARLQEILDTQTEPWGVKVLIVEVKQIDLPEDMRRAMARQATAERERRAKVINAEGEFQAAKRLADAAGIMSPHPMAMPLRFLQSLGKVATGRNRTVLFPLPLDLLGTLVRGVGRPE